MENIEDGIKKVKKHASIYAKLVVDMERKRAELAAITDQYTKSEQTQN